MPMWSRAIVNETILLELGLGIAPNALTTIRSCPASFHHE